MFKTTNCYRPHTVFEIQLVIQHTVCYILLCIRCNILVSIDHKHFQSLASAESNSSLLVMTECDRSVGKISSVDLSKVQLTRPETPMTASRRHFEGSRPGTMEAFLGNNHEVKQVEDEIANIEISNPNKFAAFFNKPDSLQRAKSGTIHRTDNSLFLTKTGEQLMGTFQSSYPFL